MNKTMIIPVVIAALFSVNGYAEAPHAYAFGALGQAKYKDDSSSESDTSFGIGGGYWFNENFAIEGRYDDFGEVEDTERDGSATSTSKASASAFGFNLLAGVPLNEQFKLYAKVGVSFWDLDLSGDSYIPEFDNRLTYNENFSGNEFTYGFGAQYQVNDAFSLGVEYSSFAIEDTKAASDDTTFEVDGDINNLSLYASFNF